MNRFLSPRAAFALPALALAAVAVACGGSQATTPTNETPDSGTGVINPEAGPAQTDAGAPDTGPSDPLDTTYPTAHTAIPLVDYNGGNIIQNVKVVTITFPATGGSADAWADMLEQFGDTITQTPWWDTVRNGYCDGNNNCVGQGTSGGHVRLTTPAAGSYTDSSQGPGNPSTIQTMIQGYVTDGTFPPPDTNTLYAIYFPTSTSIDLDGSGSCSEFGGYHNSAMLTPPGEDGGAPGPAVETAYAILPRCDNSQAELTLAASHEFIEAATDPYLSATAYYMQNQLWGMLGGEVGDLCVTYNNDDAYAQAPFTVQRIWSNLAAAGSHDPCVPAPSPSVQPYFNVAPAVGKDQLSMKVGATKTIDLTAFSDAAMAKDFTITADEDDEFQGGPNVLTLALSQSTAHNGSKITLTVTLNAQPSGGYAIYQITSKSGTIEHSWPMAIVSE